MAVTETSCVLNCEPSELRRFLGQTAYLPEISDPDLQLEILQAPAEVAEGAEIEFRIASYGIKQRMRHRYTTVSETEIVAEQLEGPPRKWVHRQQISDNGDGTCTLRDIIEFEPPGGMLGFVMTEAVIRESIESGMEYRYDVLAEKFGT